MGEISLFEAWRLWLRGDHVDSFTWFGISIMWLGRIGKFVQFVGALTVIAEIIGPERLRNFGNSLHAAFTFTSAETYLKNSLAWYKAHLRWIASTISENREEEKVARKNAEEYGADKLSVLLTILLTIVASVVLWRREHQLLAVTLFIPIMILTLWVVAPLLSLLLIFVLTLVGALIDLIFIEPLAWALDKPNLDWWGKLLGLSLFMAGFHFDLLSS